MCPRIRTLCSSTVALVSLALCLPRSGAAQQPAQLTMPLSALRAIAADFDAGQNTIYCYYGSQVAAAPEVHVDSLRVVAGAEECEGLGIGFISRIADRSMMAAMLNGLIASHPSFRIVTAFYGAEMIEVRGVAVRAARAFSVLRGAPLKEAVYGS